MIWTCGPTITGNTPLNQGRCPNTPDEVTCYANASIGPAVCLKGASTATENYEEAGSQLAPRVRDIYVMTASLIGRAREKHYSMDANGCQVIAVSYWGNTGRTSYGSVDITFEKCALEFGRMLKGLPVPASGSSGVKYCDLNKAQDLNAIEANALSMERLGRCMEHIPNFSLRYYQSLKRAVTRGGPAAPLPAAVNL